MPTTTQAQREARRERVAEMTLHGYTIRQIGASLGVNHSTVVNDQKILRAEWAALRTEAHEQLVWIQQARLEQLERKLAPAVEQGDAKAIDQALKVLDRRARLLGLDAPTRHEVQHVTIDAVDAEIARLEALMEAEQGAADLAAG